MLLPTARIRVRQLRSSPGPVGTRHMLEPVQGKHGSRAAMTGHVRSSGATRGPFEVAAGDSVLLSPASKQGERLQT
jgi:hypothetical protein